MRISYLQSIFLNFLIVFFVNRMIPGIGIGSFEGAPNFRPEIYFSLIVGFFNGAIFPTLNVLKVRPSLKKMSALSFIVSYGSFALIPLGMQVSSLTGLIIGGSLIWLVAILSNYLEWKSSIH